MLLMTILSLAVGTTPVEETVKFAPQEEVVVNDEGIQEIVFDDEDLDEE